MTAEKYEKYKKTFEKKMTKTHKANKVKMTEDFCQEFLKITGEYV